MTLKSLESNGANDLSKWLPAKPVSAKYPQIWPSALSLTREGRQREHNGMSEMGACIIYKHKMLFHEDRLLRWFESRIR